MAIGDDNIHIGVSPDLSGFNRELDAKLRALSSFSIAINGKPVLTGFKSELARELTKVSKSKSADVRITPTVGKAEVNKFKSELNRQLSSGGKSTINLNVTKSATANLRKQIQREAFDKTFTVKVEMNKTSLKSLTKNLQIPVELKLPTQSEINLLRSRLQQRFGPVQVQVRATSGPVGNVGSGVGRGATAEVEKFGYAQRNLARDITLVGRAATQSKAPMFSFLGAISPGQVALTAFSTALIGGTRAFIKFGLESSKAIQQTNLALLGFFNNNRPLVSAFLTQMQNFAAVTPFSLESVLKTSKLLLGAGQDVTKILPQLKAIGGLGAQLGVSSDAISRVGTAIAKIAGQGKVTSRELRTIFTAFPGFQPIKALAENLEGFGGSTQKVLKAMSRGAVNANAAIDALIKGMLQYPGAADALYRQSLLLAGSQETLKDRFEQLSRAAVGNALPQLAMSYRQAAEVFNDQSKSGIGSGIRSLIRDGSDLIPIFARGIVPVIDKFAGSLSTLIPPFKQFVNDFGGAFFESFKAVLKVAPALANNLGLFFTVIKPFAPVIETVAKALNLIPTPLISIAAALKLLGTGGLFGGLLGRGSAAGGGFLSKQVNDIGKGIRNLGDYSKGTGQYLRAAFNAAGLTQYERKMGQIRTSIQNVNLESTRSKGFFGGTPGIVQLQGFKNELAATEARGVTAGQKIRGSFAAAGSAIKGAGASVLGAFGGPAGLAIAAATIGVSSLIASWQKAKAEAKATREESRLIGKELSLDSSAVTGAERLSEIMNKIANSTERGATAIKRLAAGYGDLSSKYAEGTLAKDLRLLENGASEAEVSGLIGDQKRFKSVTDRLLKEGTNSDRGPEGTFNRTIGNLFGNQDTAKENDRARNDLIKLQKQYVQSSKDTVDEQIKQARDLRKSGLVKGDLVDVFKEAKKELEGPDADPAKVYSRIRSSVQELSIAQNSLDDSAIKAALSGKGLNKTMLASASATEAANNAVDSLNTALNELILNQDNISADTFNKSVDPVALGQLSTQFAGLSNDPSAQLKFLEDVNARMIEITNDPAAAQAITTQISSWKNAAASALADFKISFTNNLPNIAMIFAEEFDLTNKGVGLAQLTSRFKKSTDYIVKFTSNLNKLYAAGFKDTAALLAAQGPAVAGKALDDAVASIGKNGKSKALANLEANLKTYETTIKGAGTSVEAIAKEAVGKQLGIAPELIIDPSYGIKAITDEEVTALATQLTEVDKKITDRKAEILKTKKTFRFRGETYTGPSTIADDPLYAGLLDEQSRLQTALNDAKSKIFQSLETQAATTAGAINTSIKNADIAGALEPGIKTAKTQIASIATGQDSLGSQIASNFGPSLKGSTLGGKSVVFKGSGSFDIKAIIGKTLDDSAKSAGQSAGEAMAKALRDSFKAGAQLTGAEATALSTGILSPFKTARLGINSLIAALTSMGTSLGISLSLKAIPEFHTGGVVGGKAKKHSGSLKDEEQLAVLLKGEAVLPHKTVNQMSPAMVKSLVKGDVDGFIPQYLKSKAYGGTNATPSQEVSASFRPASWNIQFDAIRKSIDAQMAQTKNQLTNLAFETFDTAYDMSKTYTSRFAKNEGGNFGTVTSIAALTGSLKQIAARMEADKGKENSYKTLIAFMKSTGVPFDVSSTVRPGSFTSTGGKSYHASGRAVDFTGKKYGIDTTELGNIFKAFAPVESTLAELIYGGPQAKYNVKGGKRVGKYDVANHRNHVHAALYNGALVQGSPEGIIANIGERGQSEMVLPMNSPARIMDLTTQAIRSQMLGVEGQQAMLMALVGAKKNEPSMVHHGDNVGDVIVHVESSGEDARREGEIIGMRVRSALRRKF